MLLSLVNTESCGVAVAAIDTHNRSAMTKPTRGERVRERREQLKLSQPDLAHLSGVSVKSVSWIENNKHVSPKMIRKVEEVLAKAQNDPAWHSRMAGFMLQEATSNAPAVGSFVTLEASAVNELASLAYRILAILGTAQYPGPGLAQSHPRKPDDDPKA